MAGPAIVSIRRVGGGVDRGVSSFSGPDRAAPLDGGSEAKAAATRRARVNASMDAWAQAESAKYRARSGRLDSKDLLTVMTALREWADRWIYGEGHEPLVLRHARTGERPPPLRLRDERGGLLDPREFVPEPGPGADRGTRERFRERAGRR